MDNAIIEIANNSFVLYAFISLLISLSLSIILGLEREFFGSEAGLRSHVIICLFGCLCGLISFYLKDNYYIILGGIIAISLISAFSIKHSEKNIKGITTSTTLLLIGLVGLGCGLGFFSISLIAVIFTLFVLIILAYFESKTSKADPYVICYADKNVDLSTAIIKISDIYSLKVIDISSKIVNINGEDLLKVNIYFQKAPIKIIKLFSKDLEKETSLKKIYVRPISIFNKD